jgi:hypothetical protein
MALLIVTALAPPEQGNNAQSGQQTEEKGKEPGPSHNP